MSEGPGAGRLAAVLVCVLLTAAAYAACLVAVAGGGVNALFGLLPVFAGAVIGTCAVLALAALTETPRKRIRNRRIRVAGVDLDALDDRALEVLASGGDLVEQLERRLGRGGRRLRRVAAASALGRVRSRTSIGHLSAALAGPDRAVAYAAAQALAGYDEPEAYDALLDALARDGPLPGARLAALLEGFRPSSARELIERRACSDDSQTRCWVAYLLGRLADPESAPTVYALSRDPDEDVRATAAEALGSFADTDPNALGLLLSDASWVVRCHAAKAVGKAGGARLAPRLAELLEDRSWWVRQNSALALADLGELAINAATPQLRSRDRFARNKAAEVLVRTGYAARRISELDGSNLHAVAAHQFLVDLGRAEAAPTIEAALRDSDREWERDRLRKVLDEVGVDAG